MNKIPDPKKMKKIKGPILSQKELKTAKIKVTLDLDIDLLSKLQKKAHKTHKNYQALLNQIIRQYLTREAA